MRIREYVKHESERQSATPAETVGMWKAHYYLRAHAAAGRPLGEAHIKYLCRLINGQTDYRKVPAVFNQGMPALPAQQIPHIMETWVHAINFYTDLYSADHWIKEFLDVHPFADGNGRVASLLWNYMRGTLDDPEPMPYFYGEN